MSAAYQRLVSALEARGARRSGFDWQCPGHDDGRASLSVRTGTNGALLHCHAGCATSDVVAALGMTMADLFDDASRLDARTEDAIYNYVTETGELLFQVVRFHPKEFRQRRPDGNGGWAWNLNGTRRVLFGLPAVVEAAQSGATVFVVEGERDVHAVERAGGVATCNPGGAGKWRPEYAEFLAGAHVIVVADRDEPGRKHARDVLQGVHNMAASVRIVEPREGKDAADHLAAGHGLDEFEAVGDEPVRSQVPTGPPSTEDLNALLDEASQFIRRYVVLSAHQLVAVALFVPHSHSIEAAETTPYLDVQSPAPECGKSRLLETLEVILPRVLRTGNISDSALFRTVADLESGRAVILLDEADGIFTAKGDRQDLLGLLNAGYRRGATVARTEMVGQRGVVRLYDAFGAKAIAGIGRRPDTIRSRSVPIVMRKRTRGEALARFRVRAVRAEAAPIREAFLRWGAGSGVLDALRDARPDVPEELTDRQQDAWEPLLAIADAAGGDWPKRARAAAVALHTGGKDDATVGILLLAHIRDAFGERDQMWTADLLNYLIDREDGSWAAWWERDVRDGRTKGPASKLARMLHEFGPSPRLVRIGEKTQRGYVRGDFEDPWSRYLPASESPPVPSPAEKDVTDVASQVRGGIGTLHGESGNGPNSAPDLHRNVVTFSEPSGRGQGETNVPEEPAYPVADEVFVLARLLDWPAVTVGRVSIGKGEAAWRAWARRSTPETRLAAYGRLEAIAEELEAEVTP